MNNFTDKRLRIFAGPNGSGKSTLYNYLVTQKYFTPYFYINPDDFAKNLPTGINFCNWNIDFNKPNLLDYLKNSTYNSKLTQKLHTQIIIEEKSIFLAKKENNEQNSYVAAALGEYVRTALLEQGTSFAFETVFSHHSKLDFIDIAKNAGYKTYLYFISTDEPSINTERVHLRTNQGGHFVEKEKIVNRYYKTMENLLPALQKVDSAFIFDNSQFLQNMTFDYFAHIQNKEIIFTNSTIPHWFNEWVLLKKN